MTFVDTSFWFALTHRRDQHHAAAIAALRRHAAGRLVTSSVVRGETWTLLLRRAGRATALAFLDSLERSPRLDVRVVDESLDAAAIAWLRSRGEREYSWVDATSFALMRRDGLTDVLAFDDDFASAGFTELR